MRRGLRLLGAGALGAAAAVAATFYALGLEVRGVDDRDRTHAAAGPPDDADRTPLPD